MKKQSLCRIVTWNCNKGQIKAKIPHLDDYDFDIAVIQEIATPAAGMFAADEGIWVGHNKNQGVLVLARNGYKVSTDHVLDDEYTYFIPVRVTGPRVLNLIATWVKPSKTFRGYSWALNEALYRYQVFMQAAPTIVLGDLNISAIFGDFSVRVLNRLSNELGLVSAYHEFHNEAFGEEKRPSFFHYRHQDKPFHIDYVFLPAVWRSRIADVQIGDHATWSKRSDHCPIVVDLDFSTACTKSGAKPLVRAPPLEEVPTTGRYLEAFKAIHNAGGLTEASLKMLKFHMNAPDRTTTATQMATAMGWKRFTAPRHLSGLSKHTNFMLRGILEDGRDEGKQG